LAIPASTKKVRSPASSMRSTLVFLLLCGIAHAEERLWTRAFRHGSRLPASTEACCAFSLFELECAEDHNLYDSCAKSEMPEDWQTRALKLNINLKKNGKPKKWKTVVQAVVKKCFRKKTPQGKIDRTRCDSQTSGDTADVQKDVPGRVDPSVDAVPSDSVPSSDPVQNNGDAEDADVQKTVPGGGDPASGVDSIPSVTPVQTNFGTLRCKNLNEEACCKAEPDTTAPCFYVGRFTKVGGKDQLKGWKCQGMGAMSYQMNSRGGDGHYWEVQKCRTAKASATEEVVSVGTEAKCNAIGDDCAACEKQGCAYFSVPGSSGGGKHGVATEANGFCSGVKYALNQKVGQKNGMYTKTTCVKG